MNLEKKKGKSLNLVIMGCFFIIIGALMIFLSVVLTPRISQLLVTNAIERTRETVLQSTNSLEIYVNNMLDALHFAGSLYPVNTDDEADTYFALQISLLQKSHTDMKSIAFFSDTGELAASTDTSLAVSSGDITGMEWFQKALQWQGTVVYFSSPHVQNIFEGRHDWVITLSKAVDYIENGQVKTGVLLIDYDFSAISSLVSNIQLGSSGYVYILDTEEEWIYHPRQQLVYAGIAEEDLSAVRTQVVGICRDVQDGRERVLIINTVSHTRWRMVGVAYIDELSSLQNAFIRIFTIALLCGGLLSISAASLTAYYVTRPIRYLQEKMRQVEGGGLDMVIAEQGFSEIRALTTTFNHMLLRIRALMGQIVTEQEARRLHELNALQAQINPHFLYNTLDSIIWMEERGNSQEAITMVSALARLFRISISKGRNIITVREELEHVRNYLIIQKMRFRNKFTYEITAGDGTEELRTVKLIVQPIVENAVHHAIDAYNVHRLHITVTAKREDDFLLITVSDDGIGIPEDKLESILSAPVGGSGIGLRNVHERIQLTCGKAYGLTVHSVEDEGTTVVIRLPTDLEG